MLNHCPYICKHTWLPLHLKSKRPWTSSRTTTFLAGDTEMTALLQHSSQAEEQQQDEHSAATAQPCSPTASPTFCPALLCLEGFQQAQLWRKHGFSIPLNHHCWADKNDFFLERTQVAADSWYVSVSVLLCLSVLSSRVVESVCISLTISIFLFLSDFELRLTHEPVFHGEAHINHYACHCRSHVSLKVLLFVHHLLEEEKNSQSLFLHGLSPTTLQILTAMFTISWRGFSFACEGTLPAEPPHVKSLSLLLTFLRIIDTPVKET